MKKDPALPPLMREIEQQPTERQSTWPWPLLLCTLAYVFCILTLVAPLQRLAPARPPILFDLPTTPFLTLWGSWLPADLHWLPNDQASQLSTNNLEFLFLIALAFIMYGLAALLLRSRSRTVQAANYSGILRLIWIGAILAGLVFVLTPAMLSHDLFVYADYGHTIVMHSANLYFVPPGAFPPDPIRVLDDWRFVIAAYGPLWLYISSLCALVAGDHPVRYLFAFRLLGLAAYLLNTLLVMSILKLSGRSQRTIALGTLLYAWNPLVVLESCLGAHNDIVMVTCILLGILLCMRAEQRGLTQPGNYLPPIIAFTLAALIKFTTAPLILLFLALLACKALSQTPLNRLTLRQSLALHGRSALRKVVFASLASVSIVLAFYAPFWVGHSLSAIVHSFTSPPSARYAENSILRMTDGWIAMHGFPPHNSWSYTLLYLLSQHALWNMVTTLTLTCCLVVGTIFLWRFPTTHTLIVAALATFGAFLIVTPWLFAWYVTWLVALAAVSLVVPTQRPVQALVAFALTFSVTIFFTYLANGYPLIGNSGTEQCLRVFGIPLFVLLIALLMHWMRRRPGTQHN